MVLSCTARVSSRHSADEGSLHQTAQVAARQPETGVIPHLLSALSQRGDLLVVRSLANSIFAQEHGVHKWAQESRAALQFLSLPSGCKPSQERDCCHLPKPLQSSSESLIFKFTKAKSSCLTHRRLMLTGQRGNIAPTRCSLPVTKREGGQGKGDAGRD